ncbi:hypothetical protein TSAR_010932 [Trichomalopsis sarcophagae]|uniref:Uncharacterized protein n=1 Tax=Trichomalopsis sarcophagae TaxID=543379 RepID=A0A232ED57_9HYME|nr:hypothetical protein TSAR_010932 [Trichomalopsis sarcophagae]
MSEDNNEQWYLYIHIENLSNNDELQRQIVPASLIKKFNIDKRFTIKLHHDGEKQKCYVLYAAESYDKVSEQVAKSKRFHVPNYKFVESINDTVRQTDTEEMPDQMRKSKKAA